MANREKIIIAMMIAAVFYGAFSYFFSSSSKPAFENATQNLKTLNEFASSLISSLAKEGQSDVETHILGLALAKWEKDPMVESGHPWLFGEITDTVATSVADVNFTYSGYLKTGDKIVAIINALEYEPGQALEEPGYVLLAVSPTQVIIKHQGGNKRMVVPLDETLVPADNSLKLKITSDKQD
ncbi:MAG: hypothetical protein Q8P24_09285 [Desulfobacterales bacterium]|nr:hypothetical protein [Desulfobacterales bacterium]